MKPLFKMYNIRNAVTGIRGRNEIARNVMVIL